MSEKNSICWGEQYVVEEMNRFYDLHLHNQDIRAHLKPFTDLLAQCEKGGKLLDMGVGTGITSEFCGDFEYMGCDLQHVLNGCAMRNYPQYFYRVCDAENDNLAWIKEFDVVVGNGFFDIMEEGLYIIRRVLTHAKNYVLIHRQEITEEGETHSMLNGSYGGKTYHSVINRQDFMKLLDEMDFKIVDEKKLNFGNWENGGASFLLKKKVTENKKYESHPLRQLRNRIQATDPRKIIIGAGDVPCPTSWVATNFEELDVESREDWKFLLGYKRLDNILSEHTFEHLRAPWKAAKNMFEFLKPGGRVRVAVPDGFFPNPEYINEVKPGGTGFGADDHVWLWNYMILSDLFKKEGFEIELVEYFDENGEFHQKAWSADEGMIRRSRNHDDRNTEEEIKYTSLIIDCIKPC